MQSKSRLYILFDLSRYVTRQPVKALIKSLAWCSTSGLYVPAPINKKDQPILTPNEERSKKNTYLFLVFVMSLFIRVYSKLSWNLNDQFKIHELIEKKVAYQRRWRRECNPSLSVISETVIAFGRSCLLANTSRVASRSSICQGKGNSRRLFRIYM